MRVPAIHKALLSHDTRAGEIRCEIRFAAQTSLDALGTRSKSGHWKGGYWGGQIHTSRDYLCFRKRSCGPPRARSHDCDWHWEAGGYKTDPPNEALRPGASPLKSLCGGGVPSSHPSLGVSVFFLSGACPLFTFMLGPVTPIPLSLSPPAHLHLAPPPPPRRAPPPSEGG